MACTSVRSWPSSRSRPSSDASSSSAVTSRRLPARRRRPSEAGSPPVASASVRFVLPASTARSMPRMIRGRLVRSAALGYHRGVPRSGVRAPLRSSVSLDRLPSSSSTAAWSRVEPISTTSCGRCCADGGLPLLPRPGPRRPRHRVGRAHRRPTILRSPPSSRPSPSASTSIPSSISSSRLGPTSCSSTRSSRGTRRSSSSSRRRWRASPGSSRRSASSRTASSRWS